MQSLPVRTTGQDFLHSWRHFFGLHLSELTIAILNHVSVDQGDVDNASSRCCERERRVPSQLVRHVRGWTSRWN
jgi:hypothetical protein